MVATVFVACFGLKNSFAGLSDRLKYSVIMTQKPDEINISRIIGAVTAIVGRLVDRGSRWPANFEEFEKENDAADED